MPNPNKRTIPAKELDRPEQTVVNGVTMTQVPNHMVVETGFRFDLSLYERDVLRLLQSLCAIGDGTWSGSLEELLTGLEPLTYKELRQIVLDLESKHSELTVSRSNGKPSTYSLRKSLAILPRDVKWLSTDDGENRSPYRF